MKHLFRGSRLIVFVIMLSVMTGCFVIYPGRNVPKTTLAESIAENRTKPTLSYKFIYIDDNYRNSEKKLLRLRHELLEELNKSQYFKEITEGHSVETDIELDITLYMSEDQDKDDWALIASATLWLLPAAVPTNYIVIARVDNKKGLEKQYEIKDTATMLMWIPLLKLVPLNFFTLYTKGNVRENMYRNMIVQMYEDGFIGES